VNQAKDLEEIIYPYPNIHAFQFNKWFWSHGKKSKEDRKDLIDNVIGAPGFKAEHVTNLNFEKLDEDMAKGEGSPFEGTGWKESTIVLEVPTGQKATKKSKRKRAADQRTAQLNDEIDVEAGESQTKKSTIPHFHHRKLTHIM
jgi:hypothetical protein